MDMSLPGFAVIRRRCRCTLAAQFRVSFAPRILPYPGEFLMLKHFLMPLAFALLAPLALAAPTCDQTRGKGRRNRAKTATGDADSTSRQSESAAAHEHGRHHDRTVSGQGAEDRRQLRAIRQGRFLQRHHFPSRDSDVHDPGRRLDQGTAAQAHARADPQRSEQRFVQPQVHRRHGAHRRSAFGRRRNSSSTWSTTSAWTTPATPTA